MAEYRDTLGKREIVVNMLKSKTPLSEICKAVGASREEMDEHYGDLYEKHQPLEYISTEEDRKIVWRMAAYGMPQARIAYRLGISVGTLVEKYRRELDGAKDELIDDLATTMVAQAKEGSVQAGMFLLKTRAQWKETEVKEHVGKDGAPIETVNTTTVDLRSLTDEELAHARAIAEKLSVPSPD